MKLTDSKIRIVASGEVLWDLFPDGDRFGGAAANFACHAALLGGQVSLVSAVGKDDRGDSAVAIMKKVGVNVSYVQRNGSAKTGTVGVTVDSAGKPTFVIHPHAAWDRTQWQPELEQLIGEADAVYFGTLGQRESLARSTIQKALAIAKSKHVRRVLDVNLRPPYFDDGLIIDSISMASIVKLSDDEFHRVMKACGISVDQSPSSALQELLERFALEAVALTRGAQGALIVTANQVIDQPGVVVRVCDTVGAGDAFTAAFILGICSATPLELIVENACQVAAQACTYAGALPP